MFTVVKEDSAVIVAGSMYSLPLTTERSNVLLRWEFESDEYSVQFGIAKVDTEDESNSLRYLNVMSEYPPNTVHKGEMILADPGKYLLIWDNTRSWIRERNVTFKVERTLGERSTEDQLSYARWGVVPSDEEMHRVLFVFADPVASVAERRHCD